MSAFRHLSAKQGEGFNERVGKMPVPDNNRSVTKIKTLLKMVLDESKLDDKSDDKLRELFRKTLDNIKGELYVAKVKTRTEMGKMSEKELFDEYLKLVKKSGGGKKKTRKMRRKRGTRKA